MSTFGIDATGAFYNGGEVTTRRPLLAYPATYCIIKEYRLKPFVFVSGVEPKLYLKVKKTRQLSHTHYGFH
jgi:hypothetical protein